MGLASRFQHRVAEAAAASVKSEISCTDRNYASIITAELLHVAEDQVCLYSRGLGIDIDGYPPTDQRYLETNPYKIYSDSLVLRSAFIASLKPISFRILVDDSSQLHPKEHPFIQAICSSRSHATYEIRELPEEIREARPDPSHHFLLVDGLAYREYKKATVSSSTDLPIGWADFGDVEKARELQVTFEELWQEGTAAT